VELALLVVLGQVLPEQQVPLAQQALLGHKGLLGQGLLVVKEQQVLLGQQDHKGLLDHKALLEPLQGKAGQVQQVYLAMTAVQVQLDRVQQVLLGQPVLLGSDIQL
jgi:hypothetical protein